MQNVSVQQAMNLKIFLMKLILSLVLQNRAFQLVTPGEWIRLQKNSETGWIPDVLKVLISQRVLKGLTQQLHYIKKGTEISLSTTSTCSLIAGLSCV